MSIFFQTPTSKPHEVSIGGANAIHNVEHSIIWNSCDGESVVVEIHAALKSFDWRSKLRFQGWMRILQCCNQTVTETAIGVVPTETVAKKRVEVMTALWRIPLTPVLSTPSMPGATSKTDAETAGTVPERGTDSSPRKSDSAVRQMTARIGAHQISVM